jgi:DNA-binding transcriptional MerR regulator
MRLARLAMSGQWPGPNIRRSVIDLVRRTAAQDYPGALDLARRHLTVVRAEREQAEAAADYLEHWAQGAQIVDAWPPLRIGEVARLLNLTIDQLRNWERSNLVRVPRSPHNGYRLYGAAEIGRVRVIRLLRQSGYSPMAILRMLVEFDQGVAAGLPVDLRRVLDTPRPDEDVYMAADRWLSTLAEHEGRAWQMIEMLEEIVRKYA